MELYRKVKTSERLPRAGYYLTSDGEAYFAEVSEVWNLNTGFNIPAKDVEYWLEPIEEKREEGEMDAEIFEDMVVEYLDWWNSKDPEYHFETETRQTIKDYIKWKGNDWKSQFAEYHSSEHCSSKKGDKDMHLNMQYYMEYCKENDYVTPQEWIEKHKHF